MIRVHGVLAAELPEAIVAGGLDRDDPMARHITGTVVPALWSTARAHDVVPVICHDLELHRAVKDGDPLRAPFAAMIDPRHQPDHSAADTAVVALVRGDRVIATYSARLRWIDGTFNAALASGRLIYGAEGRIPAGDSWRCIAQVGDRIRDCAVAVGGGIWSDRSSGARDRALLPLLCRLMITWLMAEWRWSVFAGFSVPGPAVLYGFPVYGAEGIEHGMIGRQGGKVYETRVVYAGRSHYRDLVQRPEFVDLRVDLDRFPASLPAQAVAS
jgi:hypothetical protein